MKDFSAVILTYFAATVDHKNFGVKKSLWNKILMCFNFVTIQAYEIKLTRKFKYTEKPCRRTRDASRC